MPVGFRTKTNASVPPPFAGWIGVFVGQFVEAVEPETRRCLASTAMSVAESVKVPPR